MSDKNFYLSELALEMLIASQGVKKINLPFGGVLKNSEPEDLHAELYSLFSNGIVSNGGESEGFAINGEVARILKCIINAKAIIRAENCRYSAPAVCYYLSDGGAAELRRDGCRKSVKLGYLSCEEIGDSIIEELELPAEYKFFDGGASRFIENIDSGFSDADSGICTQMLEYEREEIKNKIDGLTGIVDLIMNDSLKTTVRTVVFRRTVYYKVAVITESTVSLNNYERNSFCAAINEMTGEFL